MKEYKKLKQTSWIFYMLIYWTRLPVHRWEYAGK